MKKQLIRAYRELERAGAQSLPVREEMEKAKAVAFWTGKTEEGTMWELVKHSDTSYTCVCGSEKPHPSILDK